MKVWTKGLELQKILLWIRNDIEVQEFIDWDRVSYDDIILISKDDKEKYSSEYVVLKYEECFENVINSIIRQYAKFYDYYYLKKQIERGKNDSNIDTIITGSSYALLGVDESMLNKEINCSLQSQDLYYSVKCISDICSVNKNIKNIVICCNYYYFYSDLSKTQNMAEIKRVANVYAPIFGDVHNCMCLAASESMEVLSNIFDTRKMKESYVLCMEDSSYFNENRKRNSLAMRMWNDSRQWTELSYGEREKYGKERAESHNKNINYSSTFNQNVSLFFDLVKYCNCKNINIIVVVPPTTKYYREQLLDVYKAHFYEVLDCAEGALHLLDLSDDDNYDDNNFIDMDHLNDSGAEKMTLAMLDLISQIEGE